MVYEERPAEPVREFLDLRPVIGEPLLVLHPQRFRAVGEKSLASRWIGEFRAPVIGQRLFRRIEHLNHVSARAERSELLDAFSDCRNRG